MDTVMDFRIHALLWSLGTVVFILVSSIATGLLARGVSKLLGASSQEQRKIFWGFTFAGPWIVGFIIFVVGPAAASLYYSFTDYEIGKEYKWIDLENYRVLLLGENSAGRLDPHGRRFKQALFNSFYYALIGVPLQILAALGMALLLNRDIRGIRFFRTTFYLPVILAGSPAALLAWRYMFASNGGFVNVTLQRFADSFFVFDYLYRGFIFLAESINGFYKGISLQDPIGPFKYTLPAALGVLLLLSLAGEWTENKRVWAWRSAQLIVLALIGNTISTGIVKKPINPSWTYLAGIAVLAAILVNANQGKTNLVRIWQLGGLGFFLVSLARTLQIGNFDFSNADMTRYAIPIMAATLPVILSSLGTWNRQKFMVLGTLAAILGLVIFVRAIPGQLDEGRLTLITKYLTFGSTFENKHDMEYLEDVYPFEIMSSMWIYALVIVVLLGMALLNNTYSKQRRILFYGGLTFFTLFTISTFLDGRAYFNAFEDIAKATGEKNYHFAMFRQATAGFPDNNRVPLWLSNELWSKPSLVVITMWSSGAGMLIFLAALKGVPGVLYEAAEVDGANTIQKFFKITLPMISPAMFYNIVIGVIAALQTFDTVYIIQNTQTQDSLASAAYFLFIRTFRQLEIGQGAAASWILATIIVTLTILQFRFSSWVNYEV